MSAQTGCVRIAVCGAMLAFALPALAGDDEDSAAGGPQTTQPTQMTQPSLNSEQQHAVGIVVAHPLAAKVPGRLEAFGLVLDPTTLVSDFGDTSAAAAAERSASMEVTRLHDLNAGGAAASLKALEAAQAAAAKALAESESAAARFALHWGPVAALSPAARRTLIEAATSGKTLLLRADVPGRHSVGALPGKALLDVDGIEVPGVVLGPLRQSTELQSAGLLIEVPSAPVGLGPGARVPVALLSAARSGLLLPREALLYEEHGAYVYKQLARKAGEANTRYAPVKVTLLLPYGESYLVDGVDDDDDIVVHGAGVLWALEGMGAHAVDDDDD
jgi:hypothetical protein